MSLLYEGNLSSILPDSVKNYLLDIDGTVTNDVPNQQIERMSTCSPLEEGGFSVDSSGVNWE